MTKQTYVILGTILIIVFVLAGAVLVREKKQRSIEPITPPTAIPTQPTSYQLQPTYSSSTPAGWKTYENKEFGFAFDYPGELDIIVGKTSKDGHNIVSVAIEDYPQGDGVAVAVFDGLIFENVKQNEKDRIEYNIANQVKGSDDHKQIELKEEEIIPINKTIGKAIRFNIFWKNKIEKDLILKSFYKPSITAVLIISSDKLSYGDKFVNSFHFLP